MAKERRDYLEIGTEVIDSLREGQKSVNRLASELKTGWDTVDRCLSFLERLGVVEKVVDRPVNIYRLNTTVVIPHGFINDIDKILSTKGSRYANLGEFVTESVRAKIMTERSIKRH